MFDASHLPLPELHALNDALAAFITPERRAKTEQVLAQRTRHISIVLEDIFQPHNASAVVRSCECFGVQDLHVIENRYEFAPSSGVTMGANKWVDIHRWRSPGTDNTGECLQHLKEQGYTIVATALNAETKPLPDISIDQPLAVCFGTEETGLSPRALELADASVRIPMYGFTQSFNISVTCALCLYDLTERLRRSSTNWQLSTREQADLYHQWLKRVIRNPEEHIKRFMAERNTPNINS